MQHFSAKKYDKRCSDCSGWATLVPGLAVVTSAATEIELSEVITDFDFAKVSDIARKTWKIEKSTLKQKQADSIFHYFFFDKINQLNIENIQSYNNS